jgi:photosynthetic reaction center H subunit
MFTRYIDIPQMVLYAFWIFFACLIWYLRREDKREGYPLESSRGGSAKIQGWPAIPEPKTYLLPHGGGTLTMPPRKPRAEPPIHAAPIGPWSGAPLEPTGDPMADGVGPAAYALRAEKPDVTLEGHPLIVPLRLAPGFATAPNSPEPVGMEVVGADGVVAGTVSEVWVDRGESVARYLEVALKGAGGRNVLLPVPFTRVNAGKRQIRVNSILAAQFAGVPPIKSPDQITLREEDRIAAYYAGGTLYATPDRSEPFF